MLCTVCCGAVASAPADDTITIKYTGIYLPEDEDRQELGQWGLGLIDWPHIYMSESRN